MGILPLRTARLVLRVMGPADADVLTGYHSDPEVSRYQDWELPYRPERAAAALAEQDGVTDLAPGRQLQVAVERGGSVVGDLAVGLDAEGAVATLGYTLAPAHQGHGYAREAAAAVVDALFERTGVHRVEVTLDPANHASLRVVEPLGFVREGLAREAVRIRGAWVDDLRFALLRADHAAWRDRRREPPAEVGLVELSEQNLRAVTALETFWFQRAFVAPVDASLAEALVPPVEDGHVLTPWFRAVLADGEVVGFVMLAAADRWRDTPYLWRFLVDRRHQGRGIGARVVALLADRFRADGHAELLVSWVDGPGGPRAFYERLGFVATGVVDGEIEARLDLRTTA